MSEKEKLQQLASQIQACKCDQPYYYVSYSTRDGESVYQDVLALQQAGKNLWIDVDVNFNTGEGYNSTIFNRLADTNCLGILFFMSAQSMTSAQSTKEVAFATSHRVLDGRGEALPICVVALEDIEFGDIEKWVEGSLYSRYREEKLSALEAERIEKYRHKYNNKVNQAVTKFDLSECILKVLKTQEKAFVPMQDGAEKRVEKILSSL